MNLSDLPKLMLKCLLFTIIIELVVALILGIRNKKDILNIILVNIVTNPLVTSIPVYVNITYGVFERHICLFIFEVFALVFEGLIYKKYLNYKKLNPFLLSFLLNLASFSVGEVINYLF